jgi:hypothetical protein
MAGRWALRLFGVALFVLIVAAGFGQAVRHLWNWLMPNLFGLHSITYWQALGLLCLCWILFGGLRGWPGRGLHSRHGMRGRWEQMTPEQREKFRQGMRHRCGGSEPPAAAPSV